MRQRAIVTLSQLSRRSLLVTLALLCALLLLALTHWGERGGLEQLPDDRRRPRLADASAPAGYQPLPGAPPAIEAAALERDVRKPAARLVTKQSPGFQALVA